MRRARFTVGLLCLAWGSPAFGQPAVVRDDLPSCGNPSRLFNRSPVAIEQIFSIVPLGNVQPPAHTFPTRHVYFHLVREVAEDFSTPTVQAPVSAPGGIWVTQVSSTENLTTGALDYSLRFAACAEVTGYFLHLTSLVGKLVRAVDESTGCTEYTTGGDDWRQCRTDVLVRFRAGRRLGTAGGGVARNALDFGVTDTRNPPLPFANPERWTDELLHAACPLDYYRKGVRRKLERLLGYGDIVRTTPPVCGAVEQDAVGTLAGVWFAEEVPSTYPEDPHLALIRDNIDPEVGVFSVGTSLSDEGLPTGRYTFRPESSGPVNTDFARAAAGAVHCYEVTREADGSGHVLLVELGDDATLRLRRLARSACGAAPWVLTGKAGRFER